MNYNKIQTIRYMGNKSKLLEFIIPEIEKVTPQNGVVCDLMAGSNAVSYALKNKFRIITNDVQYYSYTISVAVIENQKQRISGDLAKKELYQDYTLNQTKKIYDFFEQNYSDTYFSKSQCEAIDSIKFAIDKIDSKHKKALYLTALMGAMCKVQCTTGHFAQYIPKEHHRAEKLRSMDVWNEFLKKSDDYTYLEVNNFENKCFCEDSNLLIESGTLDNVDTIYLDSPYNQEHYSRFYHVLETICKYDDPILEYKGKYRGDRFKSNFCYKNHVENEFVKIIKYCSRNSINLVISYSSKGIFDYEKLISLCRKNFVHVDVKQISYSHSMQGKGKKSIIEIIITCKTA